MRDWADYTEVRAPLFSLLIRGALDYQMSLPVVPPRLAPGMTSSYNRTCGGIPGNGSDYGTGCCTLSLRVFILLLLSLRLLLGWRLLLGRRLLLGWRRR